MPDVVIGVDPGKTTGVGIVAFGDKDFMLIDVLQLPDPGTAWIEVQKLVTVYSAWGQVHLAVEQFDKRPGVIAPDFVAKYVERDIDNNVSGYYTKVKQTPALAKNVVKEARKNDGKGDALHRWGLYQTGLKHANDALRHVITYAVKDLKHEPTILKGFPKP